MSPRPRLLALRALGLGDLLTTVPALRALRAAYADHRIELAAPSWLGPLVRHAHLADDVVDAAPLAPLPPATAGAEVAVNLHGSGPESHRVLLAARPRRLLAYAHPAVRESGDGPGWREDEHEVERWCRLLQAYGLHAEPDRLDLEPPDLPWARRARGATLVHPGSARAEARWPADRFAAVARVERERGRRVLVTGGADERDVALAVARGAGIGGEAVLAGRTDVLGLAALVGAAARVVSGDTGVAHLATALGTPSVVLFGPASPARWGPPPDRPWHRALWRGPAEPGRPGEPHRALLRITVQDVLAELEALDATDAATRFRRAPALV